MSAPRFFHFTQQRNGADAQGHPVFGACLHTGRGDRPNLIHKTDFGPSRANRLASSCGGQDRKFQRARRNAFLGPKRFYERGNVSIGHCRMMRGRNCHPRRKQMF